MKLHLQLYERFSFTFIIIILNALTFISLNSFGTNIFGDKTLKVLVHLFKLIMNDYLSSTGFKSIRVCLTMHGSSFQGIVKRAEPCERDILLVSRIL